MRSHRLLPFVAVFALLAVSCGEKEYLPGELEFKKSVEAAEHTLESIEAESLEPAEYCGSVQRHYDQATAAFERLLPSLQSMAVKRYDARLSAIAEFLETHCDE